MLSATVVLCLLTGPIRVAMFAQYLYPVPCNLFLLVLESEKFAILAKVK